MRSLARMPSRSARKAELARRHLADFVRLFWPVVEPSTPLAAAWHIDVICEHLEAVASGEITRLLINIPPGHCKSLLASVFFPAWRWANDPSWRGLFASYGADLAVRDSLRCRDVIESPLYAEAYCRPEKWLLGPEEAPTWTLATDQDTKSHYKNTRTGERMSLGVGGKATGFRGNTVVIDDPINAMDAFSEAARNTANEWIDKAMSSRLNDMRTGQRVVIGQRLHENDSFGHLLAQGGWEHLCLASEFSPKRRSSTRNGKWTDPRTEDGELLFPEMFPREVLERAKVDLGSDGYASQHDQLPQPASGGMFKLEWWKRYTKLPHIIDEWIASLDCTFKETKGTDFVVCQVWAKVGASRYLVKSYRARRSFTETCELVERVKREFPEVGAFLVEDKANGPAVINTLRSKVGGLIPVDPGARGKPARAAAHTPFVQAGNIWLPESTSGNVVVWRRNAEEETGGWEDSEKGGPVERFMAECAAFPKGKNDDQVDALSQALDKWRNASIGQSVRPVVAMRRLGNDARTEM